jgi:hypothetical protein
MEKKADGKKGRRTSQNFPELPRTSQNFKKGLGT